LSPIFTADTSAIESFFDRPGGTRTVTAGAVESRLALLSVFVVSHGTPACVALAESLAVSVSRRGRAAAWHRTSPPALSLLRESEPLAVVSAMAFGLRPQAIRATHADRIKYR
jgi:hypothetical protein